jgi:hypothetical protein
MNDVRTATVDNFAPTTLSECHVLTGGGGSSRPHASSDDCADRKAQASRAALCVRLLTYADRLHGEWHCDSVSALLPVVGTAKPKSASFCCTALSLNAWPARRELRVRSGARRAGPARDEEAAYIVSKDHRLHCLIQRGTHFERY